MKKRKRRIKKKIKIIVAISLVSIIVVAISIFLIILNNKVNLVLKKDLNVQINSEVSLYSFVGFPPII